MLYTYLCENYMTKQLICAVHRIQSNLSWATTTFRSTIYSTYKIERRKDTVGCYVLPGSSWSCASVMWRHETWLHSVWLLKLQ